MRCPVCAVEGVMPPLCRRCKADLELAAQTENALRQQACAALLARDFWRAWRLREELTNNKR
jgi:hypothetical protein